MLSQTIKRVPRALVDETRPRGGACSLTKVDRRSIEVISNKSGADEAMSRCVVASSKRIARRRKMVMGR